MQYPLAEYRKRMYNKSKGGLGLQEITVNIMKSLVRFAKNV